jgi:hypothetical protein
MAIFDPASFLDSTVQGTISTERKLIPAGEYAAFISDIKANGGTSAEKGTPWARLDITWEIDSQELRDSLHRAKIVVTQGVMLDLDEEGAFDTRDGRNVNLGKLLALFNLNNGTFQPRALVGQYAKIRIEYETYKDKTQEKVKSVMKA